MLYSGDWEEVERSVEIGIKQKWSRRGVTEAWVISCGIVLLQALGIYL